MTRDQVDQIREEWSAVLPDFDTASLQITGRLLRLATQVSRAAAVALTKHRLSVGDFSVLATLRRLDRPEGVTPRELARATMVTSGAATGRIDRLEKAGLVRRRPDPEDRRGIRVHLTSPGRRRAEAATAAVIATDEGLLAPLSEAERDRLAAALRKVSLAVERPAP